MSDAALQIKIGADVKQAVAGIQEVNAGLTETTGVAKEVAPATDAASKGISKIAEATRDPIITIGAMKLALKDLKEQLDKAVGGGNIESLKIQIKGVSDAIKESTTVAGPAKEGFEKLRVGLEDVGRLAEGKTGGIRGIAQNFALLGPEITIAVAALGFLGVELLKFAGNGSIAEQAQEKLNKTIAQSGASVQGEIIQIKDLTGILSDETNSREVRTGAFKKLQDEYPNALKNMSLEKTSLADIQTALNKVTDAILRQAQIKGLESAISDLYKKQAELTTESTKEILENASAWDKVVAVISGLGSPSTVASGLFVSHAEKIGDTQTQVNILNNKLKELLKTSISFDDDGILNTKKGDGIKSKSDDTLRFLEETKKNLEEIGKVDLRPVFQRFNDTADGAFAKLNADILKEKIAKAITDGTKNGVSPENIKALTDSMKGLFDKKANANLSIAVTPLIELRKPENVEKEVENQFKHLDVKAYIHLTIAGFDQDVVKANAKAIAKAKKQLAQGIGSTIGDVASAELANVGTIIGDSLNGTGGQLDGAIKNIAGILGSGLKTIGQLYIKTGVEMALASKAFKALIPTNPVAAIAVGVGLEVLGTVLENTVQQKSAHAFATGGIVTQATLGLVGEAGPEAIFPLSQLDKFIKNTQGASGAVNVTGRFKLAGADMVVGLKRAQKLQNMV